MYSSSKNIIFAIIAIFSLRMLGLFLLLPILAIYLESLNYSTPLLAGIALGGYGFTQALLQIPMGLLSDIIGRKKVVFVGLLMFIVGSLICGLFTNIYIFICGRLLQGAGAISAALIALLSDVSHPKDRSKYMAFLGMSIGLSFTVAFIIGPLLTSYFSIANIFGIIAFLGFLALIILVYKIPDNTNKNNIASINLKNILMNKNLLFLAISILFLHAVLIMNFAIIPKLLTSDLNFESKYQSVLYLGAFIIAILFAMPMLRIGEKLNKTKNFMFVAIFILGLAELTLFFAVNIFNIFIGLILFFIAFNFLEAQIPSLVSRVVPENIKGAAMGVYSTSQFLGPAVGGLIAGLIRTFDNLSKDMFLGAFVIVLAWGFLFAIMDRRKVLLDI